MIINDTIDNSNNSMQFNQIMPVYSKNSLHAPQVVNHLKVKMMPYYFLWGSMTLICTGLTRLDNGVIERHQGDVKFGAKKGVAPHSHIINNYDSVRAGC